MVRASGIWSKCARGSVSIIREERVACAREELLSLLDGLRLLAEQDGQADQGAFFGRVHAAVARAREPDDLAEPFLELSTSAFLGFHFSPVATLLLDRALEVAQHVSMTLSASTEQMH